MHLSMCKCILQHMCTNTSEICMSYSKSNASYSIFFNLLSSISYYFGAVWHVAEERQYEKMYVTKNWVLSSSVSLNSSLRKKQKWHPLTSIDIWCTFLKTWEWMWARGGRGWCISAVVTTVDHLHWCRSLQACRFLF